MVRNLNAVYEEWPTTFFATGQSKGLVWGDRALQEIYGLGREVILTDGIHSPWFSGRAEPFDSRSYPLELWLNKHPLQAPKTKFATRVCSVTDELSDCGLEHLVPELLVIEYIAETHETEAAQYLLSNKKLNNPESHPKLDSIRAEAALMTVGI